MKGKSVTFRPNAQLRARLEKLCEATERPMTYYLEKAIEYYLPELERKYDEELRLLRASEAEYKIRSERSLIAERHQKSKAK